jgi:replicative DNA helicase
LKPATDGLVPQAPDAEAAVLGAMMLAPDCVPAVLAILRPEHFYLPKHAKIFKAIASLSAANTLVDLGTVANELHHSGDLDAIGGSIVLLEFVDLVYTGATAEAHARIVLEKAVLRELVAFGNELKEASGGHPGKLSDLLESCQERIGCISATAQYGESATRDWQSLSTDVSAQVDENQSMRKSHGKIGIAHTGLATLDRRIGGFRAGQFIVVGGRTGQGKTAFATGMLIHMASRENVPVAMFSLEMTDIDIGIRIVCAHAGVSAFKAMNGELSDDEVERFCAAQAGLYSMPLYLDKTINLTVAGFQARAQELIQNKGVRVIVLDYLQLMGGSKKAQNREQEVAAISRACKAIALGSQCVVVALSQLSREAEKRERETSNKLPSLTDLRESGAIEQDADIVLFPWRKMKMDAEGVEERQSEPMEAKIVIGKQRNGSRGVVDVMFLPESMTFADKYWGADDGR